MKRAGRQFLPADVDTTMEDKDLNSFYQQVANNAHLRSNMHAARWSKGVLNTLGLNLDRKTKKALSEALPPDLAEALTGVFWLAHFRDQQLSSNQFQKQVARRSGVTDAQFARIPILAVFGGLKEIIDAPLSQRVAGTLSPEVRDLWERA